MDKAAARLTSRLLSYALPFLYLLTSISFYLHTYDSAQVKITVVQMGGVVLIGLWYVRLVCDLDRQWNRYALVAAPLVACLASGLLAFSHCAYPGGGLEETLRRVFYVHFGLIALFEINTVQRLRRMILFLLVAVAIAAIYGFIQFIDSQFYPVPTPGFDPFIWRQAFGIKVFSTFGNPNFYGNFLVILTPITLSLILKRNPEKPGSAVIFAVLCGLVSAFLWHTEQFMTMLHLSAWSTTAFILVLCAFLFYAVVRFSFLGILFFLITLSVVVTESKGSWVGYTASLLSFMMLVLFYFTHLQSEKLRKQMMRSALVILLFSTVGIGFYAKKRMTSIRFRVTTWVSTWEMAQWHPVWGNGVGSFRILYPAVRRVQIFHIEGKHNTETDHSENEYWEVLQDEGIIGFGLFLWMIATFSVLGLRGLSRFTEGLTVKDPASGKRKMSQDARSYFMLGILAAFWGMLMHNLMDVSLRFVSSGIFLWLLAGLIGAMVVHDPMPAGEVADDGASDPSARHPEWLVGLGRLACLAAFGLLTFKVLTEFNDAQGPLNGILGEQLLWIIAWVAMLITLAGFWYAVTKIALSLKQVYGFLVLLVVMAWPLNFFWGNFMADVFHNRGIYFSKQGKWVEALDNYSRVVKRNPYYIMAYYFMGNVYTDRWGPGDVDRAMKEYENVWAIAPNYVQTHHQAGLVFLKKGQGERHQFDVLRSQGKFVEAGEALKQAEASWKKSLYYFSKYHAIDPVFEPNYARAGWVHLQLAEIAEITGRKPEALAHQDTTEKLYTESLYAWKCRAPENDVLHENWESNHRHFTWGMFENLGNVRYLRGNMAGAARAYALSLWQNPEQPADRVRVLKNYASVLGRLGRNAQAAGAWSQIRKLSPQDPDVLRVFHGQPAPRP